MLDEWTTSKYPEGGKSSGWPSSAYSTGIPWYFQVPHPQIKFLTPAQPSLPKSMEKGDQE